MASKNSNQTNDELFQAQVHLYRHMYSFLNPMCIKWAVDLDIPNIIHKHGQPITLSDLVSAIGVPPPKATSVERLMRLLAHNGFFAITNENNNEEEEEASYVLTPVSDLLVRDIDRSLSPMVQILCSPLVINSYNHLSKWTCGEEQTLVDTTLGTSFWDFMNQNPTVSKAFNESMESDSNVLRFALRDCKSVFENLDSLIDVGGGTGITAKIICEAFPRLKCSVLDLPHVVADLTGTNNLTFVGGDMFKSIPQADAVLLKCVLHDWSDDDCIKILENCKEAISAKDKQGKVIIIDIVINKKQDEPEMTEIKILYDIAMMTTVNGKERDEKNWKQLFMKAGFKHYKVFPIFGFRSLIELYP